MWNKKNFFAYGSSIVLKTCLVQHFWIPDSSTDNIRNKKQAQNLPFLQSLNKYFNFVLKNVFQVLCLQGSAEMAAGREVFNSDSNWQ